MTVIGEYPMTDTCDLLDDTFNRIESDPIGDENVQLMNEKQNIGCSAND
jgi:hypothetical protein